MHTGYVKDSILRVMEVLKASKERKLHDKFCDLE